MTATENMDSGTSFEGGTLEINADKIEAQLSSIWKQATASFGTAMPVAKLCLSNMVVVADEQSRRDAEQMTYELAVNHPSRVILLVIGEESGKYEAYVRTSCSRDRESGVIRCWEVVQLEVDVVELDRLPGALRSLLVGSVPVVAIDFRPYQTTPRFDAILMELSDYYFVNAAVVPSNDLKKTYLPFRWYRTLVIRELLGELVSRVMSLDCTVHPVRFETFSRETGETYSDLLTGWLLHRLNDRQPNQSGNTITAKCNAFEVTLEELPWEEDAPLLRVHFSSGKTGQIREAGTTGEGFPMYRAVYEQIIVERAGNVIPFSRYVVGTLHDRSEFTEFASTNSALDRLTR